MLDIGDTNASLDDGWSVPDIMDVAAAAPAGAESLDDGWALEQETVAPAAPVGVSPCGKRSISARFVAQGTGQHRPVADATAASERAPRPRARGTGSAPIRPRHTARPRTAQRAESPTLADEGSPFSLQALAKGELGGLAEPTARYAPDLGMLASSEAASTPEPAAPTDVGDLMKLPDWAPAGGTSALAIGKARSDSSPATTERQSAPLLNFVGVIRLPRGGLVERPRRPLPGVTPIAGTEPEPLPPPPERAGAAIPRDGQVADRVVARAQSQGDNFSAEESEFFRAGDALAECESVPAEEGKYAKEAGFWSRLIGRLRRR